MRVAVEKVYDNEKVDSNKIFKLEIEQLDITDNNFYKIADKIKSKYENKSFALAIIHYATVYLRIYNFIGYLRCETLSKEEVLDILSKIKVEIQYINNEVYDNFKKCFLSFVDEKSNLHQIHKLDDCINDLYVLVKNQNVDK